MPQSELAAALERELLKRPQTLRELAERMTKRLKRPITVKHLTRKIGEVPHVRHDGRTPRYSKREA